MPTPASPNPRPSPPRLRDTLQLLAQQLNTVHRDGCWDEDFARLMTVHHAGAQRLAAVEIAQGQIVRDEQVEIKQYQRWLQANTRK